MNDVKVSAVKLMSYINDAELIILESNNDTEYAKGIYFGLEHVKGYLENLIDCEDINND